LAIIAVFLITLLLWGSGTFPNFKCTELFILKQKLKNWPKLDPMVKKLLILGGGTWREMCWVRWSLGLWCSAWRRWTGGYSAKARWASGRRQ
jgi:hypothetical protein